jgi:2-dehydro-3-deoxygluconokinase
MESSLNIKDAAVCRWDLISLGEILLRFDPVDRRIHDTRNFQVWDGGAEYNVAANLSRVFRKRTAIASVLHDNSLGRLAEDFARQSGVDTSLIRWSDSGRNGLYFIERGYGLRAPASAFDRADTAISRLTVDEINWADIFARGTRWFHSGGVFAGLSDTTPAAASEAMKAAAESGAVVSYDLNYRDSLWRGRGGRSAANAVNAELAQYADVVFGVFDFDSTLSKFDLDAFNEAASTMAKEFPKVKYLVSTLRSTHSASLHDLGAACFSRGEVTIGRRFERVNVVDRVGSGDAFVSGFIESLLEGKDTQTALDCGTAHGVLAMTTPGDVSGATYDEIARLMQSSDASALR